LTLEHCPRCLAKAGVPIQMFVSDVPPAWSSARKSSADLPVQGDLEA
jgi:hypothetical protein